MNEQIENRYRFDNAEDALRFIKAGQGRFRLVSKSTGKSYLYRAMLPKQRSRITPVFVGVLTGSALKTKYHYIGTLWPDSFKHGHKSKVNMNSPIAVAVEWTLSELVNGKLPDKIEIWHEGRCGKCGKALVEQEDIKRGMLADCLESKYD